MDGRTLLARGADAAAALRRLRRMLREHGGDVAESKLACLAVLAKGRLPRADSVLELHELLGYLSAYPDSPALLEVVRRMLASFAQRADLRAHRDELADTGIAGTALHSEFYWFTADWLARHWPGQLTVDWDSCAALDKLDALLYPILQEHERLAYEGSTRSLREFVDVLRAPDETDAAFLIRAFRQLRIDPLVLEQVYDSIGLALRLAPGVETPARTHASFPVARVEYQTHPLARPTKTVRERIETDPLHVRPLALRDARKVVRLGREAMITRSRDQFAFMHADPRDAHLVDFGEGLQFSCVGLPPERRHLLYAQYILLALRNGIPVGYVQACALFDSAEINFNVFDTFRGAEASRIFVSSLALARHLFGVDAFTINTQQLGEDNTEALESGAWWFYYKHGFRPRHADVKPIVQRELAAKRRNPAHRSTLRTLERLCTRELYYFLDRPRRNVIGQVDPSRIGAAVAAHVGEQLGVSGFQATRACSSSAADLLGVRSQRSWSPGQRLTWRRWAPLVVALPGIEGWTRAERKDLVEVIRRKGGPSEVAYVAALRGHRRLSDAILELA